MSKKPTLETVQEQVLTLQETLDRFMKLYMGDQKLFDDIPAIGNVAQSTKERVVGFHKDLKDTVQDEIKTSMDEAMEPVLDEVRGLRKIIREKKFITLKGRKWPWQGR